jgi:orotate phosphoribosyltransferase
MIFRSYAQAASDVREWSRHLPEVAAVCGLPRSGTIVAGMLAQFRHIHLVEWSELQACYEPWSKPHRRNIPATVGKVLVLDDTCWTGRTINNAKGILNSVRGCSDILWGALYVGDKGREHVDYAGFRLPTSLHTFEWNLLRDCLTPRFMVDMDGVLCEDWGKSDVGEHLPGYLEHLENARPLYKPCYRIGCIVTARLEKYRPQTEAWLAKHGIEYNRLEMFPSNNERDRERYGHAQYKADAMRENPQFEAFVESNLKQAREIARLTGRPVLSIEGLEMFNGTALGECPVRLAA